MIRFAKATEMSLDVKEGTMEVRSMPHVMTVKELSGYLRVHPSTIYKLLRKGELPGFRIGTDWRFNVEAINRWCSERNFKMPD